MSDTVWGIVKNGVVIPSTSLPEGTCVELRVCETLPEVSPELLEELQAWRQAGADGLELVERLAQQMEADEKK